MDEIADKIMTPTPDEEDKKEEEEAPPVEEETPPPVVDAKGKPAAAAKAAPAKSPAPGKKVEEPPAEPEEQEEEEEEKPPEEPKFAPNDYMEKAELPVPQDPFGEETVHADLIILQEKVKEIIEQGLLKTLTWLMAEKQLYAQKVQVEGKDLQDKSVEELDENLRKQWPRKGRLEVEVFQERKGQITTHNKKYERHVRTCLEKYNMLEEQW